MHWLFLEDKKLGLPKAEKFFMSKGVWFYATVSVILSIIAWFAIKENNLMGFGAVNVRISADKNVERRTRFQDRALAYDGGTSTLGCDLDALPHGNALVRTSGLGRTASDVDIFTNHHAVV